MKRLLILLLTLASFSSSHAQVKLEDVVKPGCKLIYAVSANGSNYDFIVTVKDLKGSSFDWEMSAPANQKGTIIHTAKAQKDAYKMYNYFASETKKLDDLTLSVWISQKVFNTLVKGEGIKMCMYDPLDEPQLMRNFGDGEFVIRVDGDAFRVNDKMIRFAKKTRTNTYVVDQSNDDYFTFYNSIKLPIILRMRDKFTLTLKEIKTK